MQHDMALLRFLEREGVFGRHHGGQAMGLSNQSEPCWEGLDVYVALPPMGAMTFIDGVKCGARFASLRI